MKCIRLVKIIKLIQLRRLTLYVECVYVFYICAYIPHMSEDFIYMTHTIHFCLCESTWVAVTKHTVLDGLAAEVCAAALEAEYSG